MYFQHSYSILSNSRFLAVDCVLKCARQEGMCLNPHISQDRPRMKSHIIRSHAMNIKSTLHDTPYENEMDKTC
jgi:hypothetical protein